MLHIYFSKRNIHFQHWFVLITNTIDCTYFSKYPSSKRIEERFFSDEAIAKEHLDREEHKHMLENQIVGQKSSSEIRKILRHRQKYDTEL